MLDSQTVKRLLAWLLWHDTTSPKLTMDIQETYINRVHLMFPYKFRIQTLVFSGSRVKLQGSANLRFICRCLPIVLCFYPSVSQWCTIFRRIPFHNRAGLELRNRIEMMMMLDVFLYLYNLYILTSFDMTITARKQLPLVSCVYIWFEELCSCFVFFPGMF